MLVEALSRNDAGFMLASVFVVEKRRKEEPDAVND